MVRWKTASHSRTGGRRVNEDYCGYAEMESAGCWVVADGLGGHHGGEVASHIVVEEVLNAFRGNPQPTGDGLKPYIAAAHDAVCDKQSSDPILAAMRSTVVVLGTDGASAGWAHVGDSRLYHFRGGVVAFQTKDHSVCQALVHTGEITQQEIRFHEDRNRLLRVVGTEEAPRIEVCKSTLAVQNGDAFLLCSDGWWEYVTEAEMEVDLAKSSDPAEWLQRMEERLLRKAKAGHDNYTAIAVFAGN